MPSRPKLRPALLVRSKEPVIVVRELDESAPSYAYARGVQPSGDGESATVVEVTREQRQPDEPVQIRLVMTAAGDGSLTEKELLP
jgi:hypothetical protein